MRRTALVDALAVVVLIGIVSLAVALRGISPGSVSPRAIQTGAPATGSPAADSPATSSPVAMTGSATPTGGVPDMDTLTHPTSGIQFSAPKDVDWTRKKLDDDSLQINKGEEVLLVFKVIPRNQMDEFSKKLDAEIDKHLTDQKADESSATEEVNGLKISSQRGTGRLKGKPVEWEVWAICGPSSENIMFMIGFGELKANETTLAAMRKSFAQANRSR